MRRRIWTAVLFVALVFVLMPCAMAASGTKLAALTFDDGPGAYTQELLDGLAERDTVATFFVQGFKAEQDPKTIRRMAAEGHQVANHSYDHPDLSTLPLEDAYYQLRRTDRILNDALGTTGGFYYRAPYGNSTEALRASMDGPFFYWSLDSEDWITKNEGMIRNQIITEMFDGAIILCHDTVSQTVDAALDAVDHLKKQGFEFVTLKELFRRRGAATEPGEQYYSYLPSHTLLPALEAPELWIEKNDGRLTVSMYSPSGVPIYYTVDGSDVMFDAQRFRGSFQISLPCTIRAVAALDLNGARSKEITVTYSNLPDVGDEAWQKPPEDVVALEPSLTRAELAQALYHDFAESSCHAETLFSDVRATDSCCEAITWGYYAGLFSGTGEGTFEPDRQVTRQELAKVLAHLMNLRAADYWRFDDENRVDDWAWEAVQAVIECGIMETDEDLFRPYATIPMNEFHHILDRVQEFF